MDKISECGLLLATMRDPLSSLIEIIRGEKGPNAVGFYYTIRASGESRQRVQLYHTFDNRPLPWLRFGQDLEQLLCCSHCTRLSFYPILNEKERFLSLVLETVRENGSRLANQLATYTLLLQERKTAEETGYSLVNRVLLQHSRQPLQNISQQLLLTPALGPPLAFQQRSSLSRPELLQEEIKSELLAIVAVFLSLFLYQEPFRERCLRWSHCFDLLNCERKIISLLINGVWKRESLSLLLERANRERQSLTLPPLPSSPNYVSEVVALGLYLQERVSNNHNIEQSVVIDHYNRLAQQASLPLIERQEESHHLLSLGQIGSIPTRELHHLLVYLDSYEESSFTQTFRNAVLSELALRQKEDSRLANN